MPAAPPPPPPRQPAGAGRAVLERKQKADGTWREYPCTLLKDARPALVVVRFVMTRGGSIFGTPLEIPAGSVSDGYFWARRPYNLYRMKHPDGSVIAHRLDAVAEVRLEAERVSYRDLVVDWWVLPDGTLIEEDRDELEALASSGVATAADLRAVEAAAVQVLGRYRHIVDEAERIERGIERPGRRIRGGR